MSTSAVRFLKPLPFFAVGTTAKYRAAVFGCTNWEHVGGGYTSRRCGLKALFTTLCAWLSQDKLLLPSSELPPTSSLNMPEGTSEAWGLYQSLLQLDVFKLQELILSSTSMPTRPKSQNPRPSHFGPESQASHPRLPNP